MPMHVHICRVEVGKNSVCVGGATRTKLNLGNSKQSSLTGAWYIHGRTWGRYEVGCTIRDTGHEGLSQC